MSEFNAEQVFADAKAYSTGWDEGYDRGKVAGMRQVCLEQDVSFIQGIAGCYAQQFLEGYTAVQYHFSRGNQIQRTFPDSQTQHRAALEVALEALKTWIDYLDTEEGEE